MSGQAAAGRRGYVRGTLRSRPCRCTRRTRFAATERLCHALGPPRGRAPQRGRRWSGPASRGGRRMIKHQRSRFAASASERQEEWLTTARDSRRRAAKAGKRLYHRPRRLANKIPPTRQRNADFDSGVAVRTASQARADPCCGAEIRPQQRNGHQHRGWSARCHPSRKAERVSTRSSTFR